MCTQNKSLLEFKYSIKITAVALPLPDHDVYLNCGARLAWIQTPVLRFAVGVILDKMCTLSEPWSPHV